MAARQLSDGGPAGNTLGQSTTDLVGFYGATPVVQPTASNQAAVTAAVSLAGAVLLLIEVRTALVNLGLMKGS